MSLSSIVSEVKKVLADLPTIRTTVVAALGAFGAVFAFVPHTSGPMAAVVSGITALTTFLSSPKFIKVLTDLAS